MTTPLNRRALIRRTVTAGGLAAAATALPGALGTPSASGATANVATLRSRYAIGDPRANGYRPVITVAGEPHVTRAGLGAAPQAGRATRRQGLLSFVQLSDVHVIDAQSPLRVEWVDRFDDPSPLPGTGLFTSAYRPQEMLSGQVADSMVRAINRVANGPVTGKPLALAIQTGDNSDNSQLNEVRWNIGVLNGGTVRIDSGDLTRWEGVADNHLVHYDRAYWHPHGNLLGQPVDRPRSEFGFPVVPGLLDAARRPFTAEGLDMPWYSVFGNHDGLAQGNFPANTMQLNLIATGNLKIVSPPLGVDPNGLLTDLVSDPAKVLSTLLDPAGNGLPVSANPGVRTVTADPDRRLLTKREFVEQHFALGGRPVGHGFTAANRTAGTGYYSFDQGPLRFVVMDTCNPNGYQDGSLEQSQFDWLSSVLTASADKIVMVFSHHTSETMDLAMVGTGADPEPRVTGDKVLAKLLAHHNVVAWINGHTHTNRVTPRVRADGGGLWEITTASHIDWPQQARIIEVTDNADGTLSIFTTMVDHAGPASTRAGTVNPVALAALSRELSANDWHSHSGGGGEDTDRNVELLVANPLA